jgi:hypothetical protein
MTLLQVLSIHTAGSGVTVNKTKAKTIHFAAILNSILNLFFLMITLILAYLLTYFPFEVAKIFDRIVSK